MVLDKYPIGLHADTKCFRCCSTTWNQECQEFILSRMKASDANIKPVFVIEEDESLTMYMPNNQLTELIKTPPTGDMILVSIKEKQKARWMKLRTMVQKCNLTSKEDKERLCQCIEQRDYFKNILKSSDEKFVNTRLKSIRENSDKT